MKTLRWLDKYAELVVMSILMLMITVIMFGQVVMRYVFSSAMTWPEEACRYSFIWLSYIGISYSIRDDSQMKVDIIHTLVPKVAPALNLLGDFVTLVVMALMIMPGLEQVEKIRSMGTSSAAMSFPMWIVYLSLVVGVTLGCFRMIQKYVLLFKARKTGIADVSKVKE